jgi:hypothetical protein
MFCLFRRLIVIPFVIIRSVIIRFVVIRSVIRRSVDRRFVIELGERRRENGDK